MTVSVGLPVCDRLSPRSRTDHARRGQCSPQSIADLEAEVRRGIVARREDVKLRADRLPTLPAPLRDVAFRFLQRSIDRSAEEEAALRMIFPDR